MDPLSIAAGCASLVSTISTLSLSIHEFVRTFREARKDLEKVSRELQSLQPVLRLIEDDATDEEKPTCIAQYGQKRLKAQVTWATGGQGDVEKLRTSLEAHKLSLELALDVYSLALTKEIKADTTEIRNDTMATRENTERILQQIDDLKAQLPKHVITPNESVLQRFLEEMTTYTELSLDPMIAGSDDDSMRAFYDVQEASAASSGRSQSDGSLTISSDEPRPPNVPEAKRASEPPAKVIPGGDLMTQEKASSQQPTTSRKAVEHVPFQWTKFFLPANDAKYPVSQGLSENEATSTQQRAPAMAAPASKDSDARAREQKLHRPLL
ncbi:Helo-like-N domain-containing protein [Fusarium sp. LHS14.1]|nr:Helo-like-N domain-containing protein [Fusarium sp. LHS14.1]